jgi:hypothetical protein
MDDQLVEKVAKAIALENGDDLDEIHEHKPDWIDRRGEAGGRFRDINEPFKSDYMEMAKAAIQATGVMEMREALEELMNAVDRGDVTAHNMEKAEVALGLSALSNQDT